MKERDFLNWIIACAEATGWKAWHVPAPMVAGKGEWRPYRRAAGLPDLFLLHDDPPRMIIAEVKGSGGKLSVAQRKFLSLARRVSEEHWKLCQSIEPKRIGVYAWTPDQQQTIEDMLRSKVLL